MTPLDPPAAAARRQYVLDRLVEHLVAWGSPLEHADARARQTLHTVEDAGWALPAALQGPPPPASSSTPAGRTRARLLYVHHLVPPTDDGDDARCACRQWTGPLTAHPTHLAAMLVVGGVATVEERLRAAKGSSSPVDKINGGSGTSTHPTPGTDRPGGAQRVEDPGWPDRRRRGFDCPTCLGTGRTEHDDMPDGSRRAQTCLECNGTGSAQKVTP